jgi:hypothetical protein
MNFLVVNDIDVRKVNLRHLKVYNFWLKVHSKNVFFCTS